MIDLFATNLQINPIDCMCLSSHIFAAHVFINRSGLKSRYTLFSTCFGHPKTTSLLRCHVCPRCATNGRAQEARHNCRAKRARIFSSLAVTQVDKKHAFMHVQSHSELATTIIRVGEMRLYVTQSSMQVKATKHSWFDCSKWFAPLAPQSETQTKSTCSPTLAKNKTCPTTWPLSVCNTTKSSTELKDPMA